MSSNITQMEDLSLDEKRETNESIEETCSEQSENASTLESESYQDSSEDEKQKNCRKKEYDFKWKYYSQKNKYQNFDWYVYEEQQNIDSLKYFQYIKYNKKSFEPLYKETEELEKFIEDKDWEKKYKKNDFEWNENELLELQKQDGQNIRKSLFTLCEEGEGTKEKQRCIEVLVNGKIDVNKRDEMGNTALIYSILNDDLILTHLLLNEYNAVSYIYIKIPIFQITEKIYTIRGGVLVDKIEKDIDLGYQSLLTLSLLHYNYIAAQMILSKRQLLQEEIYESYKIFCDYVILQEVPQKYTSGYRIPYLMLNLFSYYLDEEQLNYFGLDLEFFESTDRGDYDDGDENEEGQNIEYGYKRNLKPNILECIQLDMDNYLKKNLKCYNLKETNIDLGRLLCYSIKYSKNKDVKFTKILLENGIKPNTKNKMFKCYPIQVACELNKIEEVEILIEYGANTNVRSWIYDNKSCLKIVKKKTPRVLDWPEQRNIKNIIELLLRNNAKPKTQKHYQYLEKYIKQIMDIKEIKKLEKNYKDNERLKGIIIQKKEEIEKSKKTKKSGKKDS